jgi:hypothetical protein
MSKRTALNSVLKQANKLEDRKLARELRVSALYSMLKTADGLLQHFQGTPAEFNTRVMGLACLITRRLIYLQIHSIAHYQQDTRRIESVCRHAESLMEFPRIQLLTRFMTGTRDSKLKTAKPLMAEAFLYRPTLYIEVKLTI